MRDKPILAICYDFDKTLSPEDMQAQGYIQSIHYEVEHYIISSGLKELIDELEESMNFQKTHEVIKQLREVVDWSETQKKKLLRIALENNQVTYILQDKDVREFYQLICQDVDGEETVNVMKILEEGIR